MPIETCDVKKIKVQREATEKQEKRAQQIEDRRDTKFKVKAQKVPLNKNAQQFTGGETQIDLSFCRLNLILS